MIVTTVYTAVLCIHSYSCYGRFSVVHKKYVIGTCICSNDVNVCGSAHCGWVVNGSVAMAAF